MQAVMISDGAVVAEISGERFEHPLLVWLESTPSLLGTKYDAESREFYTLVKDGNGEQSRHVIYAH